MILGGQADRRTGGQADKRTSGQADKKILNGLASYNKIEIILPI
jgi:hypothetical protein